MVDEEKPVQVLVRIQPDLKSWLEEESKRSGRSMTWLVNHALNLWRDRLEKSRKS